MVSECVSISLVPKFPLVNAHHDQNLEKSPKGMLGFLSLCILLCKIKWVSTCLLATRTVSVFFCTIMWLLITMNAVRVVKTKWTHLCQFWTKIEPEGYTGSNLEHVFSVTRNVASAMPELQLYRKATANLHQKYSNYCWGLVLTLCLNLAPKEVCLQLSPFGK